MPFNHRKRYTASDKKIINFAAQFLVNTRYEMEHVIAPLVAKNLGRTTCAVCKQIELVKGKYWAEQF